MISPEYLPDGGALAANSPADYPHYWMVLVLPPAKADKT